MPWSCTQSTPEQIAKRLAWYFDVRFQRSTISRAAADLGHSREVIYRYMTHSGVNEDEDAIVSSGQLRRQRHPTGPQRLDIVLDLITWLGDDPARVLVAAYYSADHRSFRHLLHCNLFAEQPPTLSHPSTEAASHSRPLIRTPEIAPADEVSRILHRLAWYFAAKCQEIGLITVANALKVHRNTITAYLSAQKARDRSGPSKLAIILKMINLVQDDPAKVMVAACYARSDDEFWALMSSSIVAKHEPISVIPSSEVGDPGVPAPPMGTIYIGQNDRVRAA